MKNLLIIGAGNYGCLTKEIALSTNSYSNIDFLDDNNPKAVGKLNEYGVFKDKYECAFVAIGNPVIRKEWYDKLSEAGFNMVSVISPYSYISPSAVIKEGTIVEPKAVINTEAVISRGCLICSGAIVNHNSIVGEFCHIDCGAVVGANVVVEPYSKLNYNEVLCQK